MRVPQEGPERRRLATLAAAATIALVAGIAAGAGDDGNEAPSRATKAAEPPRQAVRKARGLSLAKQVGQTLVISFRGTSAPAYVRRALREGRAAGVILFRANAPDEATTRRLTDQLQRAGRGSVLICADQEGGAIRILPWAPPSVSQSRQSTPGEAAAQARAAAAGLRDAGVNVTLAPVADIAAGPGSVMQGRAFAGGVDAAGRAVAAAARTYRAERIGATLKHFPGLGAAGTNTDDRPVTISTSRAGLAARDLPPFQAGIDAGAQLVMAGHAVYSALDDRRIASQSPAILTRLLRGRMRFGGAVITDSLEADAVMRRSTVEVAALRSMAAGADLLLMTGPGSFPLVSRQILAGARRAERFRARVGEAAARVVALKRSLGLRAPR